MPETADDRPSSKVARLIDEYALDGLGADLEARWTDDGDERMSLRSLAAYFNQHLLKQVLLDAGMSALENDVETIYHKLTADSVSTGVQTETTRRLEQNDIDVESVEQNFVTYQAIRTYLTEWRGAEYESLSDHEKLEKDRQSIQRLLTRTHSVTEERIEKLRNMDRINVNEFEIFIDAQILCQDCGKQYAVGKFFKQKGCSCTNK